jgi:hypothetical protein
MKWSGGLVLVLCAWMFVDAVGAVADSCPNASLRTGPSANLPDCRAYELVTPADKGRTQALTFTNSEKVIASGNGEALTLFTRVPFGPNPSVVGARAVFSRKTAGWEMNSIVAPGASEDRIEWHLFASDLSRSVFSTETQLNEEEKSDDILFEAGPAGGPYERVASIPREDEEGSRTQFLGASADLGHVLFASVDHELPLSSEAEAVTARATESGATNLYEWSGGHIRLINMKQDGEQLNQCGATLGAGGGHEAIHTAVNAVSEDGSVVFFTSCSGLFMRVGEDEPIEISAPEPGVALGPSEVSGVRYNYATPDGTKVFFNTQMPLTVDESAEQRGQNKLFEYNTEAPEGERLKLVASNVPETLGVGLEQREGFYFDETGSVVYVEYGFFGGLQEIVRYETSTGKRTFVAFANAQQGTFEPSYSTPDGEFFLFTSKSLITPVEPRGEGPQNSGAGPNEMYRYDSTTGSVLCVTCGAGDVPAEGELVRVGETVLETNDAVPAMTQMSEDGRRVFFQTSARLVPQDTNSTEDHFGRTNEAPGLDVYEWEAEGTEEAPGVVCGAVVGCTHLISSGEDVGPARLLGASTDGSNVFFESASQLVPQDMDEFPDIYDARVDGGFPALPPPLECLSCQGVGSPPPLFSVPASEAFTGAGNTTSDVAEKPKKQGSKKKRVAKKGSGGKAKRSRRGKSARSARRARGRSSSRRGSGVGLGVVDGAVLGNVALGGGV